MLDFILIISIVMIFFLSTWALGRYFRTYRYFKLIPAVMALLAAIYHMYMARNTLDPHESLTNEFIAVMLLIGALTGALTAFIIDRLIPYLLQRKYKK